MHPITFRDVAILEMRLHSLACISIQILKRNRLHADGLSHRSRRIASLYSLFHQGNDLAHFVFPFILKIHFSQLLARLRLRRMIFAVTSSIVTMGRAPALHAAANLGEEICRHEPC